MQLDVEKLVPGATVLFPEAEGPAEIVSIKPGEYWTFVFRDAHDGCRGPASARHQVRDRQGVAVYKALMGLEP